jgi:pimeloyl-ACP methyl ester carboxylesterase
MAVSTSVVRHVFLAGLASVAVVGCGGHGRSSETAATAAPANPVIVGPGRLVGIGGGRSLYLHCMGSGTPTVLLEAGFGGNSNDWIAVQRPLARTTRTCAYDRAGLGNSVALPGVHDAGDEVADLQRLLDHAHLAPPYVLVGHSYGGLLVRLYAHAHPDTTAGVVLVEAMGHDQDRRYLPVWRAQPARVRRQIPKPTGQPVENGVDVMAGERLDAKVTSLGDVPLAVVTRGRDDDAAALPARVRRPFDRLWAAMQDELAAMSPDHLHVVAIRSGHFVPAAGEGQPAIVIGAARAVVGAARSGASLPACRRVFTGPGARCPR